MPTINAQRLMSDLKTLRTFGATQNGVVRPSLSEIDMAARRWLAQRMQEADLVTRIDGVGNVVGQSKKPGKALLVGSHSDTQPRGGWLDGALGVIYGLEVARALAEDNETAGHAVDAVAWVDEEGTYLGCLGSRAFCSVLSDEDIAAAASTEGQPLREALTRAGLDRIEYAHLDTDRHLAYLEAHIEQGPYLEAEGNQIGVVTSIVGIRGYRVQFTGEQNHAGTTPMTLRKDAGVALVEFTHRAHAALRAVAGSRTVWTVGRISLDPGAPSIIPGKAEMLLQMRDPDENCLDAMEAALGELTDSMNREGPVAVELVPTRDPIRPTIMDEGLQRHIADSAQRHAPGKWLHMPSAAGHDPMVISHHLPCAMLFIPSIGGISHDFAEDSKEEDIVLGCQVLATAAAAILRELA